MSTVEAVSTRVSDSTSRTVAGLHPSVISLASTHFIVDAYGNIYAPLLPLFIPHLGLSLTAVGVLAMCFQMATSVSQLGFGALADRWRPRVLLMTGPLVSVIVLSCVGLSSSAVALGTLLGARRPGRSRISSAGRGRSIPRLGSSQGFCHVVPHHRGLGGDGHGAAVLRSVHRTPGPALVADHRDSRAMRAVVSAAARAAGG